MRRTSPLEDFAGIGGASTPDELWRWLVLHPNATPANLAWNAVSAFKRVHATNCAEALRTASLLFTDRRWRRITGRLVAEIEDTNILDAGGLDSLAEEFLMMDAYPWRVPPTWLRDKIVRLAGGHRGKQTVYIERPVAAPLRRWAVVGRSRPSVDQSSRSKNSDRRAESNKEDPRLRRPEALYRAAAYRRRWSPQAGPTSPLGLLDRRLRSSLRSGALDLFEAIETRALATRYSAAQSSLFRGG
jgi:hypothetical protein